MKKVIIIAEGGINHNGNLDVCLQMIDGAILAGADIFKLQKRDIKSCFSKEELSKTRETPWGTMSNEEWKNRLEFNDEQYNTIINYCKNKNIEFMASAWDLNSQLFLRKYDLKYNKVASARLGHIELLNLIAEEKKHTFISTGMSTLQEIEEALNIFKKYNTPFTLLHCNSQYPMPIEDSNLLCIRFLKNMFGCEVGFSDHHAGILPSIIAVALGASVIEKHITIDRTMWGSDQAASVEPHGFAKMVEYIREIPKLFGNGRKIITEEEWLIRKKLWREKDVLNGE